MPDLPVRDRRAVFKSLCLFVADHFDNKKDDYELFNDWVKYEDKIFSTSKKASLLQNANWAVHIYCWIHKARINLNPTVLRELSNY